MLFRDQSESEKAIVASTAISTNVTLPCVTITEPVADNRYTNGRGYLTQQESIEMPYIRHQQSIDEDLAAYKHHDFPERIDEDPYLEQQVCNEIILNIYVVYF